MIHLGYFQGTIGNNLLKILPEFKLRTKAQSIVLFSEIEGCANDLFGKPHRSTEKCLPLDHLSSNELVGFCFTSTIQVVLAIYVDFSTSKSYFQCLDLARLPTSEIGMVLSRTQWAILNLY